MKTHHQTLTPPRLSPIEVATRLEAKIAEIGFTEAYNKGLLIVYHDQLDKLAGGGGSCGSGGNRS